MHVKREGSAVELCFCAASEEEETMTAEEWYYVDSNSTNSEPIKVNYFGSIPNRPTVHSTTILSILCFL